MAKQLIFDDEARRSLKKGIDILAGAVKSTLGPKGRNVALDKKFGAPSVTLTASASLSTPVFRERRADSENSNCLATICPPLAIC